MEIKKCVCGCVPIEPVTPDNPNDKPLGPSVVNRIVPLASGLNIPVCKVRRAYADYYTICRFLPYGQQPDTGEFVEVSADSQHFNYYASTYRIDVESNPEPAIEVPAPYRVVQDGDVFRVYPYASENVYVEFTRVIDERDGATIKSHFDVELVGYDLPEANSFNIPAKVVAGDTSISLDLILDYPNIQVSRNDVFLEQSGEAQQVDVTSNLHWWFEL